MENECGVQVSYDDTDNTTTFESTYVLYFFQFIKDADDGAIRANVRDYLLDTAQGFLLDQRINSDGSTIEFPASVFDDQEVGVKLSMVDKTAVLCYQSDEYPN